MSMSSPKSLASSIDWRPAPPPPMSVVCRWLVGAVLPLGAPGLDLPFWRLVSAAPTVRFPPLERVPPLWRPIVFFFLFFFFLNGKNTFVKKKWS